VRTASLTQRDHSPCKQHFNVYLTATPGAFLAGCEAALPAVRKDRDDHIVRCFYSNPSWRDQKKTPRRIAPRGL
jgi:hypothetical protein